MKKYFLMLVMLFTMSAYSFAENNEANEVQNLQKYSMNINTKKLGHYLQLSTDQMDAVESITAEFSNGLMFAATECNESTRDNVTKTVIDTNIKYMSYILNAEQYRKYLTVLNVTLNNRGIKTMNK